MPANRPDKTLVDYMTIAISPALIMVLVGSLAFFLLEVFYRGAYGARLTWIVGCFVFAAVLIARISMEEGAERASLYGACLAMAVGFVMMTFVDHVLLAWLVLAVIWLCAHELTWNCTLIDETEDASGEGLLQAAGLAEEEGRTAKGGRRKIVGSASADAGQARSLDPNPKTRNPQPATTNPFRRLLAWFIHRRERKAPPGLWVVYFSLAALPIFGFGQLLLPPSDLAKRRSIYWLVFWYVASALGLLLSTSFLGLRRYLRQRKLQMPVEMAGVWLAVGAAMIVVMLIVAAIVPRPNPEYAISALSGSLGSPDLNASRYAPLEDSPAKDEEQQSLSQAPATEETSPEAADTARSDQPGSSESQAPLSQPDPQGQGKGAATNDAKGKSGGQSAKGKSADGKSSSDQSNIKSSGESKSDKSSQDARGTGDDQSQAEADTQREPGNDSSADAGDPREASKDTKQQEESRGGENRRPSSSGGGKSHKGSTTSGRAAQPSPPASRPWFTPPSAGWLLPILKGLLYLAIIVGGLYLLVRYWTQVKAWLARFWQELLDFWHGLFAQRRGTGIMETAPEKPRPRPFAAFRDPFLTGASSRVPVEELVRYTFEALEAWAAERGLARSPDETPLEFSARLGEAAPALAAEVRELAGLYARVAYARESLPASCAAALKRCWQAMRAAAEQREESVSSG